MSSAVDICNLALNLLGEDGAVTSISPPDGSAHADHCARFYPLALRKVLESGSWAFATKREYLVPLPWTDVAKYTSHRAYALPPDCLRIIGVTDARNRIFHGREAEEEFETAYDTDHKREIVLTEAPAPVLVYIADVQNPALFPAYFTEALVLLLACYLFGPVTRADTTSTACTKLMQQYEQTLAKAKNMDASASVKHREMPRVPSNIKARWV